MAVDGPAAASSRGTIASGIGQMEAASRTQELRRIMGDPHALTLASPVPMRVTRWIRYEPVLDSWTGPFLMAGINTGLCAVPNMLRGYDYGRTSPHKEVIAAGAGLRGVCALPRCTGTTTWRSRTVPSDRPVRRFALPARAG